MALADVDTARITSSIKPTTLNLQVFDSESESAALGNRGARANSQLPIATITREIITTQLAATAGIRELCCRGAQDERRLLN